MTALNLSLNINSIKISLLSHSSNIDNFLESLDSIFKDWFNRLHDTESSFHIINLWLHSFNSFHLSGNFNEWLSIIESLQDSGSQCFLDVLDGSGFGNSGIIDSVGFWIESWGQFRFKLSKETISAHLFVWFFSFNVGCIRFMVMSSLYWDEGKGCNN